MSKKRSFSNDNNHDCKKQKTDVKVPTVSFGILGSFPGPALGTLPLGVNYPSERISRSDAVQLIRHAIVENGVRFIDTADSYCANKNDFHYMERVVAEAVALAKKDLSNPNPPTICIATKGGMARVGSGDSSSSWRPKNLTYGSVRELIRNSQKALAHSSSPSKKLPPISLWQLHHCDSIDPNCDKPQEFEKWKSLCRAMKDAVDENEVRAIGLCNCSAEHVRVAHSILKEKLVSVQNEFSLYNRTAEKPAKKGRCAKSNKMNMIKLCEEMKIAFLPYATFGGLKHRQEKRSLSSDFPELEELAKRKGLNVYEVVSAWNCKKYPDTVVPLVGARSIDHLPHVGKTAGAILSNEDILFIDGLKASKKK
eukprot:g5984.t1